MAYVYTNIELCTYNSIVYSATFVILKTEWLIVIVILYIDN